MVVKVVIHYNDGVSFGIEVETIKAMEMLAAWLNKAEYDIEVEGYGFYPQDVVKLELFDLQEGKI